MATPTLNKTRHRSSTSRSGVGGANVFDLNLDRGLGNMSTLTVGSLSNSWINVKGSARQQISEHYSLVMSDAGGVSPAYERATALKEIDARSMGEAPHTNGNARGTVRGRRCIS
jgi:hypothetical protein